MEVGDCTGEFVPHNEVWLTNLSKVKK
jgi:hypothetical protein